MRITGGRIVVLKGDDLRGVEIREATVVLHTEAMVASQEEFIARMALMGVRTGSTVITGSLLTSSGMEAARMTRDLMQVLAKPTIRLEFAVPTRSSTMKSALRRMFAVLRGGPA